MRQMIMSEPTKITLNGFKFMFEPGDRVCVLGREEIITEGLEKFGRLQSALKDLYGEQSSVELKLRQAESQDNIQKVRALQKRKSQVDRSIDKIEHLIKIQSDELEKYGYDKAKRTEFLQKFLAGNKEEAEIEEKAQRKEEISTIRDKIEEKTTELEQTKSELEEFIRENGYQVVNGQYQAPDEKSPDGYGALTTEQESELEEKFKSIGDIELEIEELEKFDVLQEIERDEEGTNGELDAGLPEFADRIITRDELDTLPTSDDPYDDPGGVAIGDRISQWLIDGGFQPKELGTYSEMLEPLVA